MTACFTHSNTVQPQFSPPHQQVQIACFVIQSTRRLSTNVVLPYSFTMAALPVTRSSVEVLRVIRYSRVKRLAPLQTRSHFVEALRSSCVSLRCYGCEVRDHLPGVLISCPVISASLDTLKGLLADKWFEIMKFWERKCSFGCSLASKTCAVETSATRMCQSHRNSCQFCSFGISCLSSL